MQSELKPCPFCGGRAELEPIGIVTSGYWIKCSDCGVEQSIANSNPNDAIKEWNRREEWLKSRDARLMPFTLEMYRLLVRCAKTEQPSNYIPAFLKLKDEARELLGRIDGTSYEPA